jgi:phage baseplate assembly protein W
MLVNRPVYSYKNNYPSPTNQRSIGISVIFQTPQVFNSTFTTQDQTKNQLINFILTDPGERFFNPNFGSGIRAVLFQQDTDFEGLEVTLAEKIENFVQNIKVNNINIVEGESNQINILINYSINNIQDTLTINLDNETL